MTNCNGHIRELIECCPYILINTTLDIRCAHTHMVFLNGACARPCIEWNSFLKLCWLWFCGMTNWCGHIVLLAHMLALVCKSSECAKFEALCSGLNINNCPPPSWALLSGMWCSNILIGLFWKCAGAMVNSTHSWLHSAGNSWQQWKDHKYHIYIYFGDTKLKCYIKGKYQKNLNYQAWMQYVLVFIWKCLI